MDHRQYDPFGEPVDTIVSGSHAHAKVDPAKVALRIGTSIFWTIVVLIVLARAFYLHAGLDSPSVDFPVSRGGPQIIR